MTTRAPRLAWGLAAAALVLVLTGPVLLFLAESDVVLSLSFAAVQVSTSVVGAVVASRLPRNPVGWILLAMGAGLGLASTATAYGSLGTDTSAGPLPADDLLAWFGEWSFTPVIFGSVVFLLHVFPDGHFLSPRWRIVGLLSGTLVLCATVADMFAPGRLEDGHGIMNPAGATGAWADVVTTAQDVVDPAALPVFASALAVPVIRFRRAHGVERQQLKWIVSALILVAAGLGLTAGAGNLLGDYSFFIALLSLAAMPVATGVAMMRYRLYDIDVVINRTLVYGSLTASLAAFYLGSVLLLQLVLSSFTDGSSLAIAGSTLAVAAAFRPARARIQQVVDRRFFRAKYDAGQTVERFGAKVRGQVDLAGVGSDLLAAVGSTVQPSHAALWLRDPEGRS